jgi:hypothetical protein
MNKLILLLTLLLSNFLVSQPMKIIGKTTIIGRLEIAQNDFPSNLTQWDAIRACSNLGDDWRMPTIQELNSLYDNRAKIGGFTQDRYWSKSEGGVNGNGGTKFWFKNFNSGINDLTSDGRIQFNVRAVRTTKLNWDPIKIIGKIIKIGNIEIAQFDFPNEMGHDEAFKVCIDLGKGWRLPKIDELDSIYYNILKGRLDLSSSNFKLKRYWSLDLEGGSFAYEKDFKSGEKDFSGRINKYQVRAVREHLTNYSKSFKKVDNFEIKNSDKETTWLEANNLFKNLVNGWRLPTIEELIHLSNNNLQGLDKSSYFLSSTQFDNDFCWVIDFNTGGTFNYPKSALAKSILIRKINNSNTPLNLLNKAASAELFNQIIGKSMIFNSIEIAEKDFPSGIEWNYAKNICKQFGEGWRLPTIEELNFMYNIKDTLKMSGFSWWSSTVYDDKVYYKDLKNNNFLTNENYRFGFRVVRDIKLSTLNIIGKPFIVDGLNFAQYDFPNKMNWEDAKKACTELGDGWRLPTQDELETFDRFRKYHDSKEGNGRLDVVNLEAYVYWSSSPFRFDSDDALTYTFSLYTGGFKDFRRKEYKWKVRAVKTVTSGTTQKY